MGFSQLMICRHRLPLRSVYVYMKDALIAESNKKSIFRFFLFFYFLSYGYGWFCTQNSLIIDQFWVQKRPNFKYEKSDIWFFIRFNTFRIFHVNLATLKKKFNEFVHLAEWKKIGVRLCPPLLLIGRSAYPYLGQGLTHVCGEKKYVS